MMTKEQFLNHIGLTEEELMHTSIPVSYREEGDPMYVFREKYSLDGVDSLPDDLVIGGSLELCYSEMTELPKDLYVGGILAIKNSKITSLSPSIVIGKGLVLENCPIEELPEGLEIGAVEEDEGEYLTGGDYIWHIVFSGFRRGLWVINCPIRQLPKGLKVNGVLSIGCSAIDALPEGLCTSGVNIMRTPIRCLPDDMLSLPEGLAADNSQLEVLPDGLTVGRYLSVCNTPIAELPRRLSVDGRLHAENTRITRLPNDLQVSGDIHIEHTLVEELPEGWKPNGKIYVKGTPVAYTYKSKNSRRWAKEKYGWEIVVD